MTRYLTLLLTLSCLTLTLPASVFAQEPGDISSLQDVKSHTREEFVGGMASMTLAILQDQKKIYADRKVVLRNAFRSVVDIDWIAKFVLGRAWSAATPEQRERYTDLYRGFLTESYVSNFGEDQDKRIKDIKILNIHDAEDSNFVVSTIMMLADNEDFRVDYRVSDHNDKWKVVDIIVENVSLLATHRAQFGELASSKGIDSVIEKLQVMKDRHETSTINVSLKQ